MSADLIIILNWRTTLKASEVEYIIVHYSASPPGRGDNAETVHQWHLERTPPFDGIGYHRVIDEHGIIEDGRPLYWQGAHCPAVNNKSIGVLLFGFTAFTFVQLAFLRTEIERLKVKFPNAKVCGHRDIDSNTDCPGFDVEHWYDTDEMIE